MKYPYKTGKIDIFGDEIWIFTPEAENDPYYSITFDSMEEYQKWKNIHEKMATGGSISVQNLDKIKTSIGETVFNHINSLDKPQLEKQLSELRDEMKLSESDKNSQRYYKLKNEEFLILYRLERGNEFKFAAGGEIETERKRLETEVDEASEKLQTFCKPHQTKTGAVPNNIMHSDGYIQLKQNLSKAFHTLREYNKKNKPGKRTGYNIKPQSGTGNWQVYHMDNDGHKQILEKNLSYEAAVKLWQKNNSQGLSGEYEAMNKEKKADGGGVGENENIWNMSQLEILDRKLTNLQEKHMDYEDKPNAPERMELEKQIRETESKIGHIENILYKIQNLKVVESTTFGKFEVTRKGRENYVLHDTTNTERSRWGNLQEIKKDAQYAIVYDSLPAASSQRFENGGGVDGDLKVGQVVHVGNMPNNFNGYVKIIEINDDKIKGVSMYGAKYSPNDYQFKNSIQEFNKGNITDKASYNSEFEKEVYQRNKLIELFLAVANKKTEKYPVIANELDGAGVSWKIQNAVSEKAKEYKWKNEIDVVEISNIVKGIQEGENKMDDGGDVGSNPYLPKNALKKRSHFSSQLVGADVVWEYDGVKNYGKIDSITIDVNNDEPSYYTVMFTDGHTRNFIDKSNPLSKKYNAYDIEELKLNEEFAGGGKIGEQKISFEYKGKKHSFSFTPTEPDEWTAFESKGLVFDVHYDEEYGHIVVYEVINDKADYHRTIYKKELDLKKGIGIPKKGVLSQLVKLGYGKENAENLIEKHIDIYEVNSHEKESTARSIALSIDEAESQGHDDDDDNFAQGGVLPKGTFDAEFIPFHEKSGQEKIRATFVPNTDKSGFHTGYNVTIGGKKSGSISTTDVIDKVKNGEYIIIGDDLIKSHARQMEKPSKYISVAPEGTVFVRSNSHRSSEKIRREKVEYIDLYSLYGSSSAGQSVLLINEKDYDKIKNIKGVSKPLKKISDKGMVYGVKGWGSDNSTKEQNRLKKLYRAANDNEQDKMADGGTIDDDLMKFAKTDKDFIKLQNESGKHHNEVRKLQQLRMKELGSLARKKDYKPADTTKIDEKIAELTNKMNEAYDASMVLLKNEHTRLLEKAKAESKKMKQGGEVNISKKELDRFMDYVKSFYGAGEIHADYFPNKGQPDGVSKEEIAKAVEKYTHSFTEEKTWGGGDSLDRERVRDIMLGERGMADGGVVNKNNLMNHYVKSGSLFGGSYF